VNPELLGHLTIRLFAGFVVYFLVGLKSEVGGHYPVTRAIFAATLAAGSAIASVHLFHWPYAWPVAFAVLLPLFYRPRIWMFPACVVFVAALEWALHRVL